MSRENPAEEHKGVKALKEEDGADTLENLDGGSHDLRKRLEGRRVSSWEMKVSEPCNSRNSDTTEGKGANTMFGRPAETNERFQICESYGTHFHVGLTNSR